MNEQPYFCCGRLPSEGHTGKCLERNADIPPLMVGEVIALGGRRLRVCGLADGKTVCRDYRRRIAVRNVATDRLSYLPAWRLLNAPRPESV